MSMFRSLSVAVFFAVTCSLVLDVQAGDVIRYSPQVTLKPDLFTVPGHAIDILGISPGMSLEQVKAILETNLPGTTVTPVQTSFEFFNRGVSVKTTSFVQSLAFMHEDKAAKMSERGGAFFSGVSDAMARRILSAQGQA